MQGATPFSTAAQSSSETIMAFLFYATWQYKPVLSFCMTSNLLQEVLMAVAAAMAVKAALKVHPLFLRQGVPMGCLHVQS